MKKHITTGGLARLAGVSPSTIRNYVKRGLLAPEKISDGTFVFDNDDARIVRDVAKRAKLGRAGQGGGRP